MDSGAHEWVFNPESAQYFQLNDTCASTNQLNFQAANGTSIKNFGQRDIKAFTNEWNPISVSVSIAEVRSNLAAGMRIIQAENRIVLDIDGSYIENKRSGDRIIIRHENGCFVFDLWVPAKPRAKEGNNSAQSNRSEKMLRKRISQPIKTSNRFAALSESDRNDNIDMDVSAVFIRQEDL